MSTIIVKALGVLFAGALSAVLLRSRRVAEASDTRFTIFVVGLHAGLALGLFLGIYVIAGEPLTSDAPAYYVPAARAAAGGLLPYRDFATNYAPLFPYVGAVVLGVWNDARSFSLLSIVLSAVALLLWNDLAARRFDARTARAASVLYATNGHVLLHCILGGNQTWIALALALSAWLALGGAALYSGLLQGIAVSATKVLILLFWPAFWIAVRPRWLWLVASIGTAAAIYGAFALHGADILFPLRAEGNLFTCGNLPFIIEPILGLVGITIAPYYDMLAAAALCLTYVWLLRVSRTYSTADGAALLVLALAAVNVIFMLVSKKSFTGYLIFGIYPIELVIADYLLRSRDAFFRILILATVFNVLLCDEPTLWFRLGGDGISLGQWLAHGPRVAAYWFALVDVALLTCYGLLALAIVRLLRERGAFSSRGRALAAPLSAGTDSIPPR